MPDAEAQLDSFLDKYTPEVAGQARAALEALRRLVPGAVELVYDNYNALAIGFGPDEKTGAAVLSIAVYPRWVSLFLLRGAGLADPERRLRGGGGQVRHIVLTSPDVLDEPAVRTLIGQALAAAAPPIDPHGARRLIIKSVSARQRPRRPLNG